MHLGISSEKMEKNLIRSNRSLMLYPIPSKKFSEQGNLQTLTSSPFLSFQLHGVLTFLITKYP